MLALRTAQALLQRGMMPPISVGGLLQRQEVRGPASVGLVGDVTTQDTVASIIGQVGCHTLHQLAA